VPKSAVTPNELPFCPNALVLAVFTKEAVKAFIAQLDVPNSEPVYDEADTLPWI